MLLVFVFVGYVAIPPDYCLAVATRDKKIYYYDTQPDLKTAEKSAKRQCGLFCSVVLRVCN
jgi:hypothetical protein